MGTSSILFTAGAAATIVSADGNGDGVWCSSSLIDNSSLLYMDVAVNGTIQCGTVTADGTIDFYISASYDGVEYMGGCDAGDADITWGTTGNTTVNGEFNILFAVSVNVDATDDDNDMDFTIPSVAAICGGLMPSKFAVIMENNTGVTLHATGTNNHIEWTGINYTSA